MQSLITQIWAFIVQLRALLLFFFFEFFFQNFIFTPLICLLFENIKNKYILLKGLVITLYSYLTNFQDEWIVFKFPIPFFTKIALLEYTFSSYRISLFTLLPII